MSDELTTPYLPAVGCVADLSKEDRDTLSTYGDFHLAEAATVLIRQGDSHGKLFLVLSGLLHAVRREEDRDALLGSIQKGEWLGEVDLFDPSSTMCSVIVRETAQYWVIDRENLQQFLSTYPEAGIQLLIGIASTLSRRLRGITGRLMEESQLANLRAALLTP